MYWRIGSGYHKNSSEVNKATFCELVKEGPPPGLLAFVGDIPVGWCQVTPREFVPWLERNSRLKRVDDVPVWAISCFYVRIGYRKRGVTAVLIREALRFVREAGAQALEAYPLDANATPSSSWTGFASTFVKLGFKEVARRTAARPIMRRILDG
jgi:GNAT superfamily N-acetyltransferase